MSWSGVFAPPANALGLSIEEKYLLFCTRIGRWPLPLPVLGACWGTEELGWNEGSRKKL